MGILVDFVFCVFSVPVGYASLRVRRVFQRKIDGLIFLQVKLIAYNAIYLCVFVVGVSFTLFGTLLV